MTDTYRALRAALALDDALRWYMAEKAWSDWELGAVRRLTRAVGSLLADVIRAVAAIVRDQKYLALSSPVTRRRIAAPVDAAVPELAAAILVEAQEAMRFGWARTVRDLSRDPDSPVRDPRFVPQTIQDRLREHVFTASRITMQRVRGDVMDSLATSAEEGLGIDATADRLEQEAVPGAQDWQAERIARTEVNSAQSAVAFDSMRALGAVYHRWLAADDARTRTSHRLLDGEIVRIGERFSNGLLFPGDRSGGLQTIREWISCRCRAAAFLMPVDKLPPHGAERFREDDLRSTGRRVGS